MQFWRAPVALPRFISNIFCAEISVQSIQNRSGGGMRSRNMNESISTMIIKVFSSPVLSYGKAPTSTLKLLSSVATASLYVLVTIILAVKCYRPRAEPDEDNRPYRVIEAETSF
ncbi:high affinity immunoglobulin gamma Fc receptor I-like isoform X1 [Tachysurus ichikawai]